MGRWFVSLCAALVLLAVSLPLHAGSVFKRGDVNADGCVNLADVDIFILFLMDPFGFPPPCLDAADANDDGVLDLVDTLTIVNYITFIELPPPLPGPDECGPDPTSDGLDCASYDACDVVCPPLCGATFMASPTEGAAPLTVQFTAAAEIGSFEWDFGDGTTLTTDDPIVEHTYQTPGSYDVGLTVTIGACTDDASVPGLISVGVAGFVRGDTNADGVVGLGDAIGALDYMFGSGDAPPPDCLSAVDTNDDGILTLVDPVALLEFLFQSGSAPPEPFTACGEDPTPDSLSCSTLCP